MLADINLALFVTEVMNKWSSKILNLLDYLILCDNS